MYFTLLNVINTFHYFLHRPVDLDTSRSDSFSSPLGLMPATYAISEEVSCFFNILYMLQVSYFLQYQNMHTMKSRGKLTVQRHIVTPIVLLKD